MCVCVCVCVFVCVCVCISISGTHSEKKEDAAININQLLVVLFELLFLPVNL